MKKLTYEDLENLETNDAIIFDSAVTEDSVGIGLYMNFTELMMEGLSKFGKMFGEDIEELEKEFQQEQENPTLPYDFNTGWIKDGEIESLGTGSLVIPRDREEAEETIDGFNIKLLEEGDKEYEIVQEYIEENKDDFLI